MYRVENLNKNPPEGVVVEEADNLKKWKVRLTGAPGTIYENEEFKLEFRFTTQYPLEAPDVVFIKPFIPIHPHDWSPVQTVAQVCLSIISMISSCTKKELPPDNEMYIKCASASPKKTAWAFQ
ncbi:putative ubiquitin conjugating enzyme [Mucor mucedo]|uniref:putative ubiquitin conjugating enzyme n=1 Tax=Mucor mucedo TaxID=29922 RepID=UPI00221F4611|nr:putative ubiquitin conjugating enzyme [Mucor mucedo]KAI7896261.1 putative ubiquitin conjugating enzyme [Mucor mucedo]